MDDRDDRFVSRRVRKYILCQAASPQPCSPHDVVSSRKGLCPVTGCTNVLKSGSRSVFKGAPVGGGASEGFICERCALRARRKAKVRCQAANSSPIYSLVYIVCRCCVKFSCRRFVGGTYGVACYSFSAGESK